MFYSTQLLSKSKGGALGRVWMLAHGQRLPKRAILTSSVVEIVPKILNGPTGSEVFALRVSGILMAGVVIVQNRKSRYLYSDAHDILMRVNSCYATAASVNLRTDHMRNEAITVGPFGAALDVDFLLLGHKALASPAAMVVPGPMGDADGDDDVMLVAMPASESMPLDDLMESQVPHDVRWAARSAEITMPDTIHSMTSGLAQEDTMGFGGDGDVVDMLSNWTNADGTFADYAPESMDVSAADFWATGEGSHPGGPVAQPARKRARRQKKPQQLVIDNVTELAQETYRKWLTDCDDLVTTRPTHRYKGTRKDQYAAALDQVQKDLVPVHMGALWQQWADEGRVGAQEASRVHASARHAPRDVSVPLDAGFDDGGLEQDLFGTGWSPVGGVDLDLELDDVEQLRARGNASSRASTMTGSRMLQQWSAGSNSSDGAGANRSGLPQAEMDSSGVRRVTLGANVSSIADFGTSEFDGSESSGARLEVEEEFPSPRKGHIGATFRKETFEMHGHLVNALDETGDEITFHRFVSAFDITRSHVARIFNQLLVLRSLDVIDTKQRRPFGDIHIRRGPLWNDVPAADGDDGFE